jgi:hypothetical protein
MTSHLICKISKVKIKRRSHYYIPYLFVPFSREIENSKKYRYKQAYIDQIKSFKDKKRDR